MSAGPVMHTGDPEEDDPWVPVCAQDEPWQDLSGGEDAWDTTPAAGAWAAGVGDSSGSSVGAGQPVTLRDLAGLLTTASALPRPARETGSAPGRGLRRSDDGTRALASASGSAAAVRRGSEPAAVSGPADDTAGDDSPRESRRPARPERRSRPPRAPHRAQSETGVATENGDTDPESVARAIVLRQLTAAPRSRRQLADALARKDVPAQVAARVLDRFTEVGLIDDAAYAEMLVRTRHAERGLSRRALALELHRKGISAEHAAAALDQLDEQDEESAARALVRKKLRATRGLDRAVRLRRIYAALGRKGYSPGLVSRVVREELEAEGEPGPDD